MRNRKMFLATIVILVITVLFISTPVFADTLAVYLWSCNTSDVCGEFRNYGTGDSVWGRSWGSYAWGVYGANYGTSGQGVRGYSSGTSGYGVYGYSPYNIGMVGVGGSGSGDYGGYFQGYEGVRGIATGTYGYGTWGTASGTYGIGAYGYSSNHIGVYGTGDEYGVYGYGRGSSNGTGVFGYATGTYSQGVYGYSTATSGEGVFGYAGATYGEGVEGTSAGYAGDGVRATASNTYGYAVDAYATGFGGTAVNGYAAGTSAYAGYFNSANYRGLYTNGAAGWYDLYAPDMAYIGGTIYSRGSMSIIALNDGAETLEPGDLVVFNGFDASANPAVSVAKAGSANGRVVMGVVQGGHVIETLEVNIEQPLSFEAGAAPVEAEIAPDIVVPDKDMNPLPLEAIPEGEESAPVLDTFEKGVAIGTVESLDAAPEFVAPAAPIDDAATGNNVSVEVDTGHFVKGNVEPGQYAVVAIQGFVQVKVEGHVSAGNLLVASANGRVSDISSQRERFWLSQRSDAVIGRAMESQTEGSGMVYVYLNFR